MARKKGAAAAAAPAKKAGRKPPGAGVRLLLALLAGLAVMFAVSVWLASKPSGAGRINLATVPSAALGAAVYIAVLVLFWRLKLAPMLFAGVTAVVAAAVLVNTGSQPALGRAMTQVGGMVSSSCPAVPAGKARATSPAGRDCVLVPKCKRGTVPQWSASDRPTGRCVRESA